MNSLLNPQIYAKLDVTSDTYSFYIKKYLWPLMNAIV